MKNSKTSTILAVFLAAAGLLVPGPVCGQPMDLDTPASSPLWWTLSDEISPAELRTAFRTPEAHLGRYLAAVDAGVAQRLSKAQAGALKFYYNAELNPELTPMWLALAAFSTWHLVSESDERAKKALTDFGFDPAPTAAILQVRTLQHERSQEIVQAVAAKSIEFSAIQRQAIEARGGDRRAYDAVVRAGRSGDIEVLLGSTDRSREELRELWGAWKRSPVTETAGELLPELRSRLSPEDWERFRAFLLEAVVPRMSSEVRDFGYVDEVQR